MHRCCPFPALAALAVLYGASFLGAQPSLAEPTVQQPTKTRVYIGTYTGRSKGIYQFDLDLATGQPSEPQLAGEAVNPSFLALHPNGKWLYSVSEMAGSGGARGGAVNAFAIEPGTGKLTLLNQESSKGSGPCHVNVDRTGRCALATNYNSGSVAALPIGSDGKLAPATAFVQHEGFSLHPTRQNKPHAHSTNIDPSNRFAVVCDLGLDKVLIYKLDPEKGTLTPNDPPAAIIAPGSGPRHFTFHPGGNFAYVINELASTITALAWDSDKGTLTEIQTVSTLPDGKPDPKNTTAEVQVHPSGKFLYGSNRGHDSIAMFSIDTATGRLTPMGHVPSGGSTPRNFGIDPTGNWLLAANQASGKVCVFRIDPATGQLQPTEHAVEIPNPVCVKFYPLAN